MGSLLRYCRAVSLRALLVSALLALAWLVWGAGSAHASTDPSKAAVSETALDLGLSDAPSLQTARVLPAGQDPAGSAVFSAAKTATPVVSTITKTATPVVSTITKTATLVVSTAAQATEPVISTVTQTAAPVTKTATPVVSTLTKTATPVVSTITKTAAPVVATVDHTAAAVDDAVASVTKPLPLPTVKLPQLRNPNLPVATVPKTLPTVKSPVPATFGPDNAQPAAKSPSAAVPPSRAAAVTPSAEASSFAPTSTLSGTASPVPGASNLAATQNTDSPFKTLAQLRMTASPRPLVSAIKAPARGLWNDHAAPERLNIAATHGKSGSSSGSDSSGSHTAADIAETWNGLSPAAGMLAAGVSVTPPSGPAADPGSSPD
ncbi:hypothetical protein ACIP9X_11530 [Arthrobacter sp. NPDC093125]|uniref:hypothetical protein n=1 Tax=Arthrobacter sp. NPDC093125 TaxID=3363944 RepID=UPI0037FA2086